MKLKTATLIAIISVALMVILNIVNVTIQFSKVEYSDTLTMWWKVSGILFILGWCGICIFLCPSIKIKNNSGRRY